MKAMQSFSIVDFSSLPEFNAHEIIGEEPPGGCGGKGLASLRSIKSTMSGSREGALTFRQESFKVASAVVENALLLGLPYAKDLQNGSYDDQVFRYDGGRMILSDDGYTCCPTSAPVRLN